MFEDDRERSVRGYVSNTTASVHSPFIWVGVDLDDAKGFLEETPKVVKAMELEVFDFFESQHGKNSPEYHVQTINHAYHVGEIQKRIELIQKLIPRVSKFSRGDVQDQFACLRLIAAQSFIMGEVHSMRERIF